MIQKVKLPLIVVFGRAFDAPNPDRRWTFWERRICPKVGSTVERQKVTPLFVVVVVELQLLAHSDQGTKQQRINDGA